VSKESEKLIRNYMREIRRELRGLPRNRRRRFLEEVQTRIADARSSLISESQHEIKRMLDRLGHPADIVAPAHDFAARPVRRGALEDGALLLVSPLVILVAVFVAPLLLLSWVFGAIMLWLSRAWTAGEKLIGTMLTAVSFIWAGIIGLSVEIRDPDAGSGGIALAVSLVFFLLLVQMVPAIVGVVFLLKRLGSRTARREIGGVTRDAAAAAG
jgi:HAAS domain-containing protein